MKIEEIGWVSSVSYSTELIDKSYFLPAKIKNLLILLNNNNNNNNNDHSCQGKEIRILEQQIINELRREIIDDLFCICINLNRPKILGNNMIKFSNTSRYGWSGRRLEHTQQKRISSLGALKLKI